MSAVVAVVFHVVVKVILKVPLEAMTCITWTASVRSLKLSPMHANGQLRPTLTFEYTPHVSAKLMPRVSAASATALPLPPSTGMVQKSVTHSIVLTHTPSVHMMRPTFV
jgi:hypothetical protein